MILNRILVFLRSKNNLLPLICATPVGKDVFKPSEGWSYADDVIGSFEIQLECKQTRYSLQLLHKPIIARLINYLILIIFIVA